MGLRIGLIIRPREEDPRMAGAREAVAQLRAAGHDVRPRLTFEREDAVRFAREAARARCDLVIAAGGDGTVNEVVNGIAASHWQPRLGIIPLGTANDFAAGVALPSAIPDAVAIALEGRAVAVDVARVNRRYFINVSTGGFGAEATEQAPADAKRRLGALAYLVSGAKQFLGLRPTKGRFVVDGRELHSGRFLLFAVGNARRTGGGTLLTPRAQLGDGELDVVVVPGLSRLEFLSLLPDLRAGTHLASPDVLYVRTSDLLVECEESIRVNADGESVPGNRFRYRVARRPLSVMLP